jgi:hypothetical protein
LLLAIACNPDGAYVATLRCFVVILLGFFVLCS